MPVQGEEKLVLRAVLPTYLLPTEGACCSEYGEGHTILFHRSSSFSSIFQSGMRSAMVLAAGFCVGQQMGRIRRLRQNNAACACSTAMLLLFPFTSWLFLFEMLHSCTFPQNNMNFIHERIPQEPEISFTVLVYMCLSSIPIYIVSLPSPFKLAHNKYLSDSYLQKFFSTCECLLWLGIFVNSRRELLKKGVRSQECGFLQSLGTCSGHKLEYSRWALLVHRIQ